MAYRIEFTDDALEHLRRLAARDRVALLAALRQRLSHEPQRQTRNRKRLRANPLAPWVLRVRHLRAYYGVSEWPEPIVTVRAIGIKLRERVFVGGVEIDLS
jgi:mRNA-degrading endonuclease RelE of RelBE toxin-antitoxin system